MRAGAELEERGEGQLLAVRWGGRREGCAVEGRVEREDRGRLRGCDDRRTDPGSVTVRES